MTVVDLHLIPVGSVGTAAAPVMAHVADVVIRYSAWDLPAVTLTGIACGQCSKDHRQTGGRGQIRHASVAAIRDCIGARAELEADSRAEAALMRREADYWDNGGAHRDIIAWENEQDRLRGMSW